MEHDRARIEEELTFDLEVRLFKSVYRYPATDQSCKQYIDWSMFVLFKSVKWQQGKSIYSQLTNFMNQNREVRVSRIVYWCDQRVHTLSVHTCT